MDSRLSEVLEALVNNVEVLNKEIERLGKCDHFSSNQKSLQLIERIKDCYTNSLHDLYTIERKIQIRKNMN